MTKTVDKTVWWGELGKQHLITQTVGKLFWGERKETKT